MGARPSSFKGGGGFLKDVDGTIRDYTFTDEFNGVPFVPGKKPDGNPKFHSLFGVVEIQVDGADETVSQHLFVGNADDYEISEDGKTLVPHADDQQFSKSAGFSRLLASLVEAGFPEESLPEDEFNFEAIIGARVRFGQEVVLDRSGKPSKRVAKKGKFKGREFENTTTVVTAYYGQADDAEKEEAPAKASAKGSAPKAAAKSSKKAEPEEVDLNDLTGTTVIAAIENADGQVLNVAKLKMAVMNVIGPKHAQRDAVIKLATSEKFYSALEGVKFSPKTRTLSLAA